MFELLLGLAREQGMACVIVTHDEWVAARCSRVRHFTLGTLER